MAKKKPVKKPKKSKKVSPTKAKEILEDGSVRGHALTPKQRGLFGSIASGRGR